MKVDFGRTAADYGRYRAGFPPELFDRLEARGVGRRGQRVLDVGTGTGTMARGFAEHGCEVTALDIAEPMLREAERLDEAAGVRVRYLLAPAEETGLRSGAFEAVTAGQCWYWFDRPRAASEVRRVLGPRGSLAICHLNYLPQAGNVVSATEALILRYDPAYAAMAGGDGLYPQWVPDVETAGFDHFETFHFDLDLAYTHEAWRGRIRAHASIGAKLGPADVETFDREHADLLAVEHPGDPLAVPHRVWALVART